ncbi:MAG: asparagine synthase (glutamine-hydrolyzing) [Bdellovibrionota bacterium]
MCGITGIVRLGDRPLPPPLTVERMAYAIRHRGPDGFGEYRDEYAHIANVRLAILDLKHGDQPAFNERRSIVAVYNGELYNFHDLASELRSKGHELTSTGDTIVLPHLYEERGVEMMRAMRGMFGFALWDKNERRLLLCRDRLGIKPLYIARTPDYLIFGSEMKAILASGLISPEIDRDSLDDLFSLSYPSPPRTMFRSIEELRPAHRLIATAGRDNVFIERYWQAPFVPNGEHEQMNRERTAAELRDLLRRKVADHLIADVKVGTYLSGGIDSSAITALVHENKQEALESFTISFPEHPVDESKNAAERAAAWNLKHHIVECGPELVDLFPASVYHTELPLQYPLALPFMKLSAAVRQAGVKVILTGEGADEQLAGYDCFRLERVRRSLDFPGFGFLKSFIYKRMFGWLGSPKGMAEFFYAVQSRPNSEIEREFSGVRPPWYDVWNALDVDRQALLGVNGRTVRPITRAPANFSKLVREDVRKLHPLDAALSLEMETRLPCWTVLVDDRAAMANGIETRVPFLDHEVVEWFAKLPPEFKLRGLKEKSVLRDSMKSILPEQIVKRVKQPFYSPIKEWFFSGRRSDLVESHLSDTALAGAGLFAPQIVTKLRRQLADVPHDTLLRHRLEWVLILVLGAQILHDHFVAGLGRLTSVAPEELDRGLRREGQITPRATD